VNKDFTQRIDGKSKQKFIAGTMFSNFAKSIAANAKVHRGLELTADNVETCLLEAGLIFGGRAFDKYHIYEHDESVVKRIHAIKNSMDPKVKNTLAKKIYINLGNNDILAHGMKSANTKDVTYFGLDFCSYLSFPHLADVYNLICKNAAQQSIVMLTSSVRPFGEETVIAHMDMLKEELKRSGFEITQYYGPKSYFVTSAMYFLALALTRVPKNKNEQV